MPDHKECPQCGERMRLNVREAIEWIPGRSQPASRTVSEWVCPECDYYEEADAQEVSG